VTAAAVLAWAAKLLPALFEIIAEAVKAAQPPSAEALRDQLKAAIDAHHDDWLKAARAEADRALAAAAAAEFDKELAGEVKKP